MNPPTPPAAALPLGLTRSEIIVHGLVDGLGSYMLVSCLWSEAEWSYDLVQASLALLVILLSVVILTRRFRPEVRGLRAVELGLSGLVAALGVVGAVATLAFMASGASYKGSSPDAGGMAVFAGFFLFYPCVGLIVLPFALNGSRLSASLRRRIGWLCCALGLLPFVVLLGSLGR
ncbi:MAG TPA: hypothetical protein VGQ28_11250 [Thermoanaerobaculia bacterium]|jgi:hypothetical protein|nr:hypothetical protein [Thermoanaerobaculia bacterium]